MSIFWVFQKFGYICSKLSGSTANIYLSIFLQKELNVKKLRGGQWRGSDKLDVAYYHSFDDKARKQ